MLAAFAAPEDDTGRLARGQFVLRSVRDGDLLVPRAQLPPQVSGPPH